MPRPPRWPTYLISGQVSRRTKQSCQNWGLQFNCKCANRMKRMGCRQSDHFTVDDGGCVRCSARMGVGRISLLMCISCLVCVVLIKTMPLALRLMDFFTFMRHQT